MKYLVLFAFTVVAFSSSLFAEIKVLIVDGQNNHNWKATTPFLVKAFKSNSMFKVDVSTSPDKRTGTKEEWEKWRPEFSKYDVVLSNYNGTEWAATGKVTVPVAKNFPTAEKSVPFSK